MSSSKTITTSTSTTSSITTTSPLERLRHLLKQNKCAAIIIPSSDDHQSEYVSVCDKRREFICGFSGSYGTAVVTLTHALLWTDGRYFLQAEQQLSAEWILMKEGLPGVPHIESFLARHLASRLTVIVDPWVIPINTYRRYEDRFANVLRLDVSPQTNFVDLVWGAERPPPPFAPICLQPLQFTGEEFSVKLSKVREIIKSAVLILSALDEIAWLLNLRGEDIMYNPVFLSYVIVTSSRCMLFVDGKKLSKVTRDYLHVRKIEIFPYTSLLSECKKLNDEVIKFNTSLSSSLSSSSSPTSFATTAAQKIFSLAGEGHKKREEKVPKYVWLDPLKCNVAIFQCFEEEFIHLKDSPVGILKAVKNNREIEGMKMSHVKDGVACVQYYAWLERFFEGAEASTVLSEFEAGEKINAFRALQEGYKGPSFAPISGFGPNGACVHYEPSASSAAAALSTNGMFLLDSGGQYQEGTTDVTRTVHLGEPSLFEKECYTRVLKGQIALAAAVFPSSTPGPLLDILARQPLWEVGLDYEHGTGHGVGCFLNVHEGPHGICNSFHSGPVMSTALQPGMFVTNEPGVYLEGKFGVRLENLLVCQSATTEHKFQDKEYLQFDTITLVPYQQKLILTSLLTVRERDWIDSYHARVYQALSPFLQEADSQWLFANTRPIL